MKHTLQLDIYQYAKEHNVDTSNCKTYGDIYQAVLEATPNHHTYEEIQHLSDLLLSKLIKEYDFKAVRVFAYYPLISTKGYDCFDEVYLYEHIHTAMGHSTQAFCEIHQITDSLDLKLLEYCFKKTYQKKYGFFSLDSLNKYSDELIHWMNVIHRHGFNKEYINSVEDDLKFALKQVGDNYFINLDLTDKKNIKLLYECCGITFGFQSFRFSIFTTYNGYGDVVFEDNPKHKVDDYSYFFNSENASGGGEC